MIQRRRAVASEDYFDLTPKFDQAMANFALRQQAFENSYIREQEVHALQRRAESLAADVALAPGSRAAAITRHGLPTTFASRPAYESVPQYVKNPFSGKAKRCP